MKLSWSAQYTVYPDLHKKSLLALTCPISVGSLPNSGKVHWVCPCYPPGRCGVMVTAPDSGSSSLGSSSTGVMRYILGKTVTKRVAKGGGGRGVTPPFPLRRLSL